MYGGSEQELRRPRRRRGRGLLIALIVLLVVVGALVVVADRVGAGMAERRIAQEVQQELTARQVSSSTPEVTVGGFPFLTQVLAEKYESISILLRDVTTPPEISGVRLPRLDIEARDVRAPLDTLRGGAGDIVAGTVDGTATIGYASVVKLIKQPDLRLAERGGKLIASLPIDLLGQRFTLTGEALVEAVQGKLRVRFRDLTAEGLPDQPAVRDSLNGVAEQMSIDLALPALPFGLAIGEVRALPEGLAVSARARNVPLNRAV
ncbi:MAG TPA: DUF2993 domain-containing protein [Pilimelia sp.]|nr:DUF2993 domain-containing protein [Pilimelia sp.]